MRYTLVADGRSDRVLLPILTWSLKRHGAADVEPQWADFTRLPRRRSIGERIAQALDLYPRDVLFVHRDSEADPPNLRRREILDATKQFSVASVPVVPVRMTEAWLLGSEPAIRGAAGNPNGSDWLKLPDVRRIEGLPDPKHLLLEALITASGLNRRRRTFQFRPQERIHYIPNYILDYSFLDVLPAFLALQEDVRRVLGTL